MKRRKVSTRGRKASESKVITSSPHKSEIIKAIKRKKTLTRGWSQDSSRSFGQYARHGRNKSLPKKSMVNKLSFQQDSSENSSSIDELCMPAVSSRDDAICIFCEHCFSEDASREEVSPVVIMWRMGSQWMCWSWQRHLYLRFLQIIKLLMKYIF